MKTPFRLSSAFWATLGLCGALLACTAPAPEKEAAVSEPVIPALNPAPLEEEWAIEWWIPRHQEKLALARQRDPELVFIGDSITQGWEEAGAEAFEEAFGDWRTLNLGFSGDRTENVLWRLEHGEVSTIDPELIVLMIGTNNTGHRMDPPEAVAAGVTEIVDQLQTRLPDTDILLLAIFPRGATPEDPGRVNNRAINERIRSLGEREGVFWADVNHIFLDDQGNLPESVMPDLLHPNAASYETLAAELRPLVESLTEEGKLPEHDRD